MTNQEVYNTVRDHLLKQKVKARGFKGCQYRGQAGTKCAIGCLIPDDKYEFSFEGQLVGHPPIMKAAGLEPEQYELANDLQTVHDRRDAQAWELELILLANKHGLTP